MQRVYEENEWGKVSKRIITHMESSGVHMDSGGDCKALPGGLPPPLPSPSCLSFLSHLPCQGPDNYRQVRLLLPVLDSIFCSRFFLYTDKKNLYPILPQACKINKNCAEFLP